MELAIIIILEICIVGFCAWGIMHENKLIAFERAIARRIRNYVRMKKNDLCASWLAKDGLVVEPVFAAVKKKTDVEALLKLIREET